MATYAPVQSPWEAAENPQTSFEYFGKVEVDAWFCALVKGVGKVPYDPNQLTPEGKTPRRNTAIDLVIVPLPETKLQNNVERHMIAEFGEWPDIVLPSLRDLGLTKLQELNGKYARATSVPTGRKYKNADGEEREATTLKFLQLFDTEQDCKAAYLGGAPAPVANTTPEDPAWTAPTNGNGKERETAAQFLKVYVQNAARASGGSLEAARAALVPMLDQQTLLKKYFTVDSPEVVDLLAMELMK